MSIDQTILNNVIGGFDNNCLNNVLQLDDGYNEAEEIIQVQVINHSAYYDNDILVPKLLSMKDNFTILSTNMECINDKHNELEIFVHELREKGFGFSAICIQESWLSNEDNYAPLNITGYDLIPQGKSCSAKGGLIIYLHDKFKYTPKYKVNKSSIWEVDVAD